MNFIFKRFLSGSQHTKVCARQHKAKNKFITDFITYFIIIYLLLFIFQNQFDETSWPIMNLAKV